MGSRNGQKNKGQGRVTEMLEMGEMGTSKKCLGMMLLGMGSRKGCRIGRRGW